MTLELSPDEDGKPTSEDFYHPNREFVMIDKDGQTILYDSVEDNPANQVTTDDSDD